MLTKVVEEKVKKKSPLYRIIRKCSVRLKQFNCCLYKNHHELSITFNTLGLNTKQLLDEAEHDFSIISHCNAKKQLVYLILELTVHSISW